jgi:ferredoxin-NADP reductase
MAEQKHAELIRADCFGVDTRLLSFRMAEALGFRGGQYIIVDTGIALPGGKIAKRAYSILSSDNDQHEFQIAVKRIGKGPGSNFMHRLELGAELRFSGPWGKLIADDMNGEALVFATDTGITAALGLVSGNGMAPVRGEAKLVWLAESANYFLPFEVLIARLDQIGLRNWTLKDARRLPSSMRAARAVELAAEVLARALSKSAFLAGDGGLIYPIRERLLSAGVGSENIKLECFFNNPERKAPA